MSYSKLTFDLSPYKTCFCERCNNLSNLSSASLHSTSSNVYNKCHKTCDICDGFSSLKMKGGDVHRDIYFWKEKMGSQQYSRPRSHSFGLFESKSSSIFPISMSQLCTPGGFRRRYIQMNKKETDSLHENSKYVNFPEFLNLYWNFFGEKFKHYKYHSLGSDENIAQKSQKPSSFSEDFCASNKSAVKDRKMDLFKAILLLIKTFMGTGLLFLPKAFFSGGILLSPIVLIGIAIISLYCFIVLAKIKYIIPGSFENMGYVIYGSLMKYVILVSIAVSQIVFSSTYTIFVSKNASSLIKSVTKKGYDISSEWFILFQFIIFIPFVLVRNISKLSTIALMSNILILFGIVYLSYVFIFTISTQGLGDIALFNFSGFSFFIGASVFSFESIALILPITESLKRKENVFFSIYLVMGIVTIIFTVIGILGYCAYGSKVESLIFLNMSKNNLSVTIRSLYCIAVMLSTPLQLFPAIKIIEEKVFVKNEKCDLYVYWKKNCVRILVAIVMSLIAWSGSKDFDKFVSLVGSVICIPLLYMYPPLLHLKACSKRMLEKIFDISICLLGIITVIYVIIISFGSYKE
ncbi:hypothetical protein PORY_000417 [Pneumocystis oryctolagi]|uniref:Uncharacterized protein n=1 Tax=Pneumocystis oryctolagi TaxID=42067 RepID=A0ACB7CF86_9ASCO|nr:hypothetical protein PORY_000417 [Pneumocystis oryctolagi]